MSMSLYIGLVPFEVAPIVVTLAKHQISTVCAVARGRFERKLEFQNHLALTPSEQYRYHIRNGGYRP